MTRAWLAFLSGATMSGCLFGGIPTQIDEEDLARIAAPFVCDRIRECDRGTYEVVYFGQRDCRDEQETAIDNVVEGAADGGCDYDAAGAGEAVREIADMECQDWYEGEVFATFDLIWGDCFLVF